VEAKDALRSALTDRDALTEVLRSSPYTTKAQADARLKNVQEKVRPSVPLPPEFPDSSASPRSLTAAPAAFRRHSSSLTYFPFSLLSRYLPSPLPPSPSHSLPPFHSSALPPLAHPPLS
jgi:hypothetical protein